MNNKTNSFMYAFCSTYSDEFIDYFSMEDFCLFLGDWNYNNYNEFKDWKRFIQDDVIFALISPKKRDVTLEKRILLFQSDEHYITDYDVEDKKMIVFKLDEPHKTALRNLKRSLFSKMYSIDNIERWFWKSKDFYIKYVDRGGEVRINLDNCDEIPDLEKNYYKIMYSPYHILKKSPKLKELLECLFNNDIGENAELAGRIDMKKEFFRKEQVKLLQA